MLIALVVIVQSNYFGFTTLNQMKTGSNFPSSSFFSTHVILADSPLVGSQCERLLSHIQDCMMTVDS